MDERNFRRSLKSLHFSSINRVWEFQSTKFRDQSVWWRKPWQSVEDIRSRVTDHKQIFEDTAPKTNGIPPLCLLLATGNGTQQPFGLTCSLFEELIGDYRLAKAFVRAVEVNTGCLGQRDFMNYELEFGEFCLKLSRLLVDLREKASIQQPLYALQTTDNFNQDLEFLINLTRFRQNQTKALKLRVQGQINVLYSLISQRDSRLNYIIAEESRQIASAAQQDSRTMKTIAFMTLVFLPTTLAASIFSSGAFDLKADASEGMVGSSWWILVVCSSLLTLIVMVTWWVWHKKPSWKYTALKTEILPAREQQAS